MTARAAPAKAADETWREAPIACALTPEQASARTTQWQDLLAECQRREQIPDGIELSFPRSEHLAGQLATLAAAEQQCCSFFDFTLRLTPTALTLIVRAPEQAQDLLTDVFAATT